LGQREWLGWVTEEFPNLGDRPLLLVGAGKIR
jgi:hypothetical protein